MKIVKISREALKNKEFKSRKVEAIPTNDEKLIDITIIAELIKKF